MLQIASFLRHQVASATLGRTKFGSLQMKFPDGKTKVFGHGPQRISVEVKTWKALDALFRKGDIGMAETIIDGTFVVDSAAELVEWACQNSDAMERALHGTWYGTVVARARHLLNHNDRAGAKKNILSHYDLGNEFYKLWLDPTMTYSSAIYKSPNQGLEDAQNAKYDRIIDTLGITKDDKVLEIGCGWGGFLSRAVQRTGCHVTAVTISPSQAEFCRKRIQSNGHENNVSLVERDYRDIQGQFDKIVSIEMIEAVGEKFWNTYFGKVRASLKPGGKALIQGITIQERYFDDYRAGTDFIQQYVFPGGMLLTNQIFREKADETGMKLTEIHEFGLDYAETLKAWRVKFNEAWPEVSKIGFDEKFKRLWDLYLAYCEGAFRAGRINVGQYLFQG